MAGLNIFGKTNCPEFGIMGVSEPELRGPARNPWNLDHTPGGSSGGSAAAVAAGIVPLCRRFDVAGPIARTVEDCAEIYASLRGDNATDLSSASARGLRLMVLDGIPFDGARQGPVAAFEDAVRRLAGAGARVTHAAPPCIAEAIALAPTLFAHGTPEQLRRVLPKMASGEEIWAQAWSEPESGSDLASLRSTATQTDGGWLLNGQKIWSSRAPFGDRAFGLFRSDPSAERHRGLTYFMFDLKTDGVTVRPIAQLGGDTGFGEVFLDNVFVPDHDVIGSVHEGWRAAMSTTSNERGMSLRSPARFVAPAERLVAEWKARGSDAAHADRVADAWIKAQAYRLHTFGTVTRIAEGGELGAESSVTKVFWSDLDVALHQTALELRGPDAELADAWTDGLLFALGGPIYAGTNEIQRNIIAERMLGLPKEGSTGSGKAK